MNQMTFSNNLEFDNNRKRVKFCPCGKENGPQNPHFAPFKQYDDKGYCHSCGKIFKPEKSKKSSYKTAYSRPSSTFKKETKAFSTIDLKYLKDSNKFYRSSNLVKYLFSQFDEKVADEAIKKYFLGSFQNYSGSTVFWQIDRLGKIRGGKIIQFKPSIGKRVNDPTWAHSYLQFQSFTLSQCLFGQHLLTHENKPIVVVESEKTAVVGYIYMPQYTWVATGGKSNLKEEYFDNLGDREILLIPDTDAYEDWSKKVKGFTQNKNIKIWDVIQSIATPKECKDGWDLEDYLRLYDYRNFNLEMLKERGSSSLIYPSKPELPLKAEKSIRSKKIFIQKEIQKFDVEINELEEFFSKALVPDYPIQLNSCTTVIDYATFLEVNFARVKQYNGTRMGLVNLEDLKALRNYIYNKFK